MSDLVAPICATIIIWWASTGSLLWLVRQSRALRYGAAMVFTLAAAVATLAVLPLRDMSTPLGAYAGFACGIVLWAWHESMFLFGYISGPRKTPCPEGLKTWPRFVVSTEAVIHHEIAIAVHGGLILMLSWGAPNAIAAVTFLLLWAMRLSSKFIVFLGAPNISDHMLPPHLRYLSTYFNKTQATALFPVLIVLVTGVALAFGYLGLTAPIGSFTAIGYLLLATLASLAVIEHLALVLPVPDAVLWAWAIHKQSKTDAGPPPRNRPGYGRT
ncbi:MAG: putative photosynthetic complex assembly protein PuhE [Pseudomonadota bacterium]